VRKLEFPITKNKIFSILDKALLAIESAIVVAGIFLPLSLVYYGFSRYVLQVATPYEEELTLLVHLWVIALGFSLTLRYGDHTATTIFYDKIVNRGKLGKAYQAIVYSINIAFLVIMLWYLYQTFPLLTRGVTEYMRWPFAIYYSAIVVGIIFVMIRYILKLLNVFIILKAYKSDVK